MTCNCVALRCAAPCHRHTVSQLTPSAGPPISVPCYSSVLRCTLLLRDGRPLDPLLRLPSPVLHQPLVHFMIQSRAHGTPPYGLFMLIVSSVIKPCPLQSSSASVAAAAAAANHGSIRRRTLLMPVGRRAVFSPKRPACTPRTDGRVAQLPIMRT